MYRAKIEGVSGSKVYADGKWLFSIGNKNFRTGDFVWTDGRCAYGHFQEAQQPQVIIAPPADEGIPIYYSGSREHILYSFQKNKIKQVDQIERPKDTPSGWADTKLINDKRRVFKHKYLASNIDSKGNIFVMAEVYKIDDDGYYTEDKVAIFKNDKTSSELKFNKVKEIDLIEYFDQYVVSKCDEPDIPFGDCFYLDSGGGTIADSSPLGQSGDWTIRRAFIEDENNFEILIYAGFGYYAFAFGYGYSEMPIVDSGYEAFFLIKNDGVDILRELFSSGIRDAYTYTLSDFFDGDNPPGNYADFYIDWTLQDGKWVDLAYHQTETENNYQIKCSVGDGFYCTMQWQRYPPYVEHGAKAAGGEFRYNFFAPDNTLIADMHANSRANMLFRKVKGGYLINISGALQLYDVFGQSIFFDSSGVEIENNLVSGIFLYSKAKDKVIRLNEIAGTNDRLRPMLKIRGWHKRIKEIILDLDNENET